jgi:hypothetical protein
VKETQENYGFVPNLTISIHLNARHVLGKTPTGAYFSHFTNKQFHDLTSSKSIPATTATILGFGLKFIPVPKKSICQDNVDEAIKCFNRDFYLKVHFSDKEQDNEDKEAIDELQVNSTWKPDQPPYKITQRLGNFEGAISSHFRPQRGKSNLTKFQAGILQQIPGNPNIIIAHADKNLGPVGVDTEQYICWALDKHLTNSKTYMQVSEEDAQLAASDLYTKIYQGTRKNGFCDRLTKDAVNYIRHNTMKYRSDPFGYFYLTIKIHKTPISTRPVYSDCASLVHPRRKWLDLVLQPVVASQPSYFKDLFTLKQVLDKLVLPPIASIITFDAVSMYTNIDIDDSISSISSYLEELWNEYECKAIVDVMEIVMKNNRMQIGDLIYHQICGVAMGMSPAPTIANLYVAIYKTAHIIPLLNKCLLFYKRFIDDSFAVWLQDLDPTVDAKNWTDFQAILNAMGINWTFKSPHKKLIFMDMTIQIIDDKLVTTIYAKPLALYQYIPPNSCHPPGVLTGLVYGQILWIYQLCSLSEDVDKELSLFYKRLINRGYLTPKLIPLFKKGVNNAILYLSLTPQQQELRAKTKMGKSDERILFHIPYHPQNPPLGFIQHLCQDLFHLPPGKECLNQLRNWEGHCIPIKRIIVAYHCNPNLANLNSYQKLTTCTELKPSTFIT